MNAAGREANSICEWLTAGSSGFQPSAMDGSDFGDVAGLRALRAVNNLELHCLTFFE
jgi:hypothetical protein